MTARMRRLASDWEQIKKDFAGHKNIIVKPVGEEPAEKYHVTYFVNGIYLLPDGKIETLGRHEVEITLHAEYPRYKPICKILTPIWHPNFRDGQICIGDIWGAGESLSDIIINIGDMIQYKSWNSYSPLSADAAQWAMENKHIFPVGNINLYVADYASAKDTVEIDFFDEDGERYSEAPVTHEADMSAVDTSEELDSPIVEDSGNDFEITAEELAGIEFVPTAERMQTMAPGAFVKGGKVNFKTILVKGILWAFIGALLGFGLSELAENILTTSNVARLMGYPSYAQYREYYDQADEYFSKAYDEFETYCAENDLDSEDTEVFENWYLYDLSEEAQGYLDQYSEYKDKADEAWYDVWVDEMDEDEDKGESIVKSIVRMDTALWAALIALVIGLFLGIGEGVFYGSMQQALKFAAIGAGVSIVMGVISGYVAQWMYSELLGDDPSDFMAALIRGLGWSIMGLGIGLAIGIIKIEWKRILFCALGGLGGGFIGGFLFNYICDIIPGDVVARGVAIVIMGLLIGLGVGLLEQFAKQAWLKVIRGEFEGKEYLVFTGTTSIGNNGKNTIVLFKDKLVGPHHCDIKMEGSKYVLVDCGTPMGTVVNGNKVSRYVLRKGDTIAIGNSVLVFNTK